ncbi:restriction endonuclease subunit S [Neisseria sp. HMSC066H01]|uniref:restriction endonuclease subunit S n=1 Tax=Neisseria sp. HMSC066H01 TaxID=1715031 RepID=UPI001AEFF1A3|nr:restriction endonuclease subunit S [Neisseria sp. HMSC066H01]
MEWLGDVPSHWESFPLFVQAKISSITNHIDKELLSVYLDRGVVRFSDVDEKRTNVTSFDLSKYQLVRKGNLVLNNQQAWRGSVGVSSYEGIVSPAYLILELSNKFDPHYANYLFRNGSMVSHYLIASKGVGTIQRNLYWGNLRRAPIFIPPLSEQQKIAQFLDDKTAKIDQAVDLTEKQIALLKEHKQILIQNAVTRGLNPDVPLKDSGVEWIGKVPEPWEVKQIKYLTKIYRGKFGHRPRNDPALYDGIYPFVQTGDVARANKYITNYTQTLNDKGIKVSQLFPQGALLMAIAANIGDVAILDFEAYAPDSIVGFTPNKEISLKFLYYCFITLAEELKRSAIQNTQANLNIERIGSIKSVYPNIEEQCQITNYLDIQIGKIDQTIELKTAHIEKLKEYKSVLINDVVTGKVRV